MEAEQYRRASYDMWAANAPGWERWRAQLAESLMPVRRWLIRALAPSRGDTVLELSAGPGDTGFAAADLLGSTGRLISTDFSPEMVEVARRRGRQLGLENVEYRIVDAERMDLDSDCVDGVLCQSGYMLMAEPANALAETRRILRSGGRLALSVWAAPARNPWVSIIARILVERGHLPVPQPGAPGIFSMARQQRTQELLQGAGFHNVRTDEVPVTFAYRSLDEYEQWITDVGGPLAIITRRLPAEERAVHRAQLARELAPFAADDGYELPGAAMCAVAS